MRKPGKSAGEKKRGGGSACPVPPPVYSPRLSVNQTPNLLLTGHRVRLNDGVEPSGRPPVLQAPRWCSTPPPKIRIVPAGAAFQRPEAGCRGLQPSRHFADGK